MADKNKLKEYERTLKRNLLSFIKYLMAGYIKGFKITEKEVHEALEFTNILYKGNIESNDQYTTEQKEALQTKSDSAFAEFEEKLKNNVLIEIK